MQISSDFTEFALPTNGKDSVRLQIVGSDAGAPLLKVTVPGRRPLLAHLDQPTCELLATDLDVAGAYIESGMPFEGDGDPGDEQPESSSESASGSAQDASGAADGSEVEEGAPTQPGATGEASSEAQPFEPLPDSVLDA